MEYLLHISKNNLYIVLRHIAMVLKINYNEDGSITVPEVLKPYMGGLEIIK